MFNSVQVEKFFTRLPRRWATEFIDSTTLRRKGIKRRRHFFHHLTLQETDVVVCSTFPYASFVLHNFKRFVIPLQMERNFVFLRSCKSYTCCLWLQKLPIVVSHTEQTSGLFCEESKPQKMFPFLAKIRSCSPLQIHEPQCWYQSCSFQIFSSAKPLIANEEAAPYILESLEITKWMFLCKWIALVSLRSTLRTLFLAPVVFFAFPCVTWALICANICSTHSKSDFQQSGMGSR